MLQPTSPLRVEKDLKEAINQFIKNKNDSLWSISKIDKKYHPLKQLINLSYQQNNFTSKIEIFNPDLYIMLLFIQSFKIIKNL